MDDYNFDKYNNLNDWLAGEEPFGFYNLNDWLAGEEPFEFYHPALPMAHTYYLGKTEAKLAKAIEALAFYADPASWGWKPHDGDSAIEVTDIEFKVRGDGDSCGGIRAREALKDIKGE